jgi:flagellar motor switch protein FliN/FliY
MPEERQDENVEPEAGSPADGSPDEAAEALQAARQALDSIQAEADAATGGGREREEPVSEEVVKAALNAAARGGPGADAKPFELPDFDLSGVSGAQHGLDMLADVQLDVRIELGRTRMLVEDVLRLSSGAVVELDKLAGDPLDVYVNDRLVARGEVLVLNDNFCIRVNEIVDSVGEQAGRSES